MTIKRPSRASGTTRKTNTRQKSKVSRPTKARRKPRRKARRFPWFSLALVAVCLAAGFLIGRWALPPPPKRLVVPLSQKVRLVDLTLKSQLYMLGLTEKDVVSRTVAVRKRGDRKWTQTTTRVQLPRSVSFRRIIEYLNRELGTLGSDFSLIKKGDDGRVLELQVRVEDVVAHNIIFYAPKVVKPEVPVKGKIAIVIDDLGLDRNIAIDFLNLEAPLSFSVFPFGPHSREFARRATSEGRDVLLHLPMEPKGYPAQDPGEGRLLTSMGREQLLSQLEEDLSAVPYVTGVNNHMGSKFTEDPERMRLVLEDLKRRGLFFLDSRTTPNTVGFRLAQELGLKTGQRNVFLDNERDVSRIKHRISELIRVSHKNGGAIGIGHPHPETVQALREVLPSLRENGVELVPVSTLLE